MIQSTASLIHSTYSSATLVRVDTQRSKQPDDSLRSDSSASATNTKSTSTLGQTGQLTPQEQQQVQELKQIDRKVRAHEQAHMAAGADLVRGGPSFSYTTGPDNQRYAVGGEVSIDTSPGRTPEETIPKAQHIRAAALAPADPSSQDRSVAAQASQMEGEARIELSAKQQEESAKADQTSTHQYLGVEQDGSENAQVGRLLDSFA